MIRNIGFLVLVMVIFIIPTFAQDIHPGITKKGLLIDTEGQPVDMVQIVVKDELGNIIEFLYSNSVGEYSISFPNDGKYTVSFQRLGFKKIEFENIDFESEKIILHPSDNTKLREVVIRDNVLVEETGDTINYVVKNIIDGTERKLEDVLAKLPGLKVNSNGKISFQGREISKILLDGDDLTGENYQILSKGLSADWLEDIQILKRFTGNKLLQGVKKSDDIAINIKLKEDFKSPLFGKASLGAGTWKRAELQAELLHYNKSNKGFWVTESSNLGDDIEVMNLNLYDTRNIGANNFQSISTITDRSEEAPEMFSASNFNFQRGIYTNPNLIFKINDKIKFKSNTTVTIREREFIQNDSSFFFTKEDQGFSINQKSIQSTQFRDLFQSLTWTKEIKSNQELEISGRAIINSENISNQISNTFRNQNQQNLLNKYGLLFSSKYLIKLDEKQVLDFEINVHADQLQEDLSFAEGNISELSPNQRIEQSNHNFGIKGQHLIKWSEKTFAESVINYTISRQILERRPKDHLLSENFDDFSTNYQEVRLYTNFTTKWKEIDFWASSNIRNIAANWSSIKMNYVFVEPTLKSSYEKILDKNWIVSNRIAWTLNNTFLQLNEWVPLTFSRSFRHEISNESDPLNPERSQLLLGNIEIKNKSLNYFVFNTELGIRKSENAIYSTFNFIEDLISETQLNDGSTKDFNASISTSKYFSSLSSLIKISYDMNNTTRPLGVGEILDTSHIKNQTGSITAGFVGLTNIRISLGYNYNSLINNWNENKNRFVFHTFNSTINYTPIEILQIRLNYEGLNIDSQNLNLNSILKAEINFKPKDKKWELGLFYNNIMNNRSLAILQIAPGVNSRTDFSVLPNFVLLKAKWNF